MKTKKLLGAALLKQWRLRMGMTQTGAARLYGMEQRQYSMYETTKRPGLPNAVEFLRVAKVPCEAWMVRVGVEGDNVADPTGQASRAS